MGIFRIRTAKVSDSKTEWYLPEEKCDWMCIIIKYIIPSFTNQEWTEWRVKSNLHADEIIVIRNRTDRKEMRMMKAVLVNSFELLQILLRVCAEQNKEFSYFHSTKKTRFEEACSFSFFLPFFLIQGPLGSLCSAWSTQHQEERQVFSYSH